MKGPALGVACRLGMVVVGVSAVLSCASSGGSPSDRDQAATATDASRKTQQEVQSELMAFADRYFAAALESAKILESAEKTPESRYTAASARVAALVTVPDPSTTASVPKVWMLVSSERAVVSPLP